MPSEGFLSRWSRRKQALSRGEELAEPPPEAPAPVEPPAPEAPPAPAPPRAEAVAAEAAEEPAFDLSSLPDIETIDATTDVRAFFHKAVPEGLRQAALRKAWATDPVISTYMGPLDYAWDFNTPGGLPFGFASELGEVGDKLRELIAQAIGEPPARPEGESGPESAPEGALAEAPPAAEPGPEPAEALPEPPPSALRLAEEAPPLPEPAPPAAAAPAPETEAPPPPPRRRHGGALPA